LDVLASDLQYLCTKCGELKSFGEFTPRWNRPKGKQVNSWCKKCNAAYLRDRSAADPGAVLAKRDARRMRLYGLSQADYDAMLVAQDGSCAICDGPAVGKRVTNFFIDHDHACCPGTRSCGECVRGLLCNTCNRLLGLAFDNAELLRAAADYLEKGIA
jgi:hypothetical protein